MKKALSVALRPINLLLFASIYLPAEIFHGLFAKNIDDFIDLYDDWRILCLPLAVVLTAISVRLLNKPGRRFMLSGMLYLLYYGYACFEIANAHRLAFGNTWSKKEVLFELVLSHRYFYIIGLIGVVVFFLLRYLMAAQRQDSAPQ